MEYIIMKKFIFTVTVREYFDYVIDAQTEDEAREIFLRGDWKDELDFSKPSDSDAEDNMEEV
jgi:hypothetical protein